MRVRALVSLGFPSLPGLEGRPRFLVHEHTVQTIYRTAILSTDTAKVVPQFPSAAPAPLFQTKSLALGIAAQVAETRKRVISKRPSPASHRGESGRCSCCQGQ